jgi:ABC-type dipeptide/oligopeptide/nickel transport system permease subunit
MVACEGYADHEMIESVGFNDYSPLHLPFSVKPLRQSLSRSSFLRSDRSLYPEVTRGLYLAKRVIALANAPVTFFVFRALMMDVERHAFHSSSTNSSSNTIIIASLLPQLFHICFVFYMSRVHGIRLNDRVP